MPEELQQRVDELTRHIQEVAELRRQKKETAKDFQEQIDEKELLISSIADELRSEGVDPPVMVTSANARQFKRAAGMKPLATIRANSDGEVE
jgi:DNA-binding protein H-NS